MDSNRFDDLTRALADGISRRQVLKLFVATVVGGLVSTEPSGGSASCPPGTVSCGNTCVDTSINPLNCGGCGLYCPPESYCSGGRCYCNAGLSVCYGKCVNTNSDPSNCGSCGNNCFVAAAVCMNGICQCGSPAFAWGEKLCSGMCVDTNIDRNNCGGCGIYCPGSCLGGACS